MSLNRSHENPWVQLALDNASDGIMIETAERVSYVNASYARLLGYRGSNELVRLPVETLIADCDADRLLRFGRLRASGDRVPSSYDFAAQRCDGNSVRLQASVSISYTGTTPYIMTIVRPFSYKAHEPSDGSIQGPHDSLSERERMVMGMVLAGKRPKMIAFDLNISEKTVATHRVRLLGKIGVADNRELFQYALRHRLVDWS